MKYINALAFRVLGLFILAILMPSLLLASLSATYFKAKLTEEINNANSQTAALLVYNIDNYILELERLTLAPYTNIEFLKVIKQVEKNIRSDHTRENQLLFNKLDYIVPKSFMYVGDQMEGISLSIDGQVFIACEKYNEVKVYQDDSQLHEEWYRKAIAKVGASDYYGMHRITYYPDGEKDVFSVVKVLKDYNTNKILGVIKADGNADYIRNMMQGIGFAEGTIIVIRNEENQVMYKTALEEQVGSAVALDAVDEKDYIISTNEMKRTGWEIQILSPKQEIENKIATLFKITFYIMLGCILVALVLYGLVVRRIIDPFSKLLKGIKGIEKGDFETPICIKSNLIELNVLQDALNHMQYQVKEHINKEYKAVLARKNAEYEALQARINPHFLYNTLAGFITLNRIGEQQSLQQGILALTGLMRYIFEKQSQATIEKEIVFIKQYLDLSKMRFEERLQYEIEAPACLNKQSIPKLLLQPIVENSVVHGLEEAGECCMITIRIHLIVDPFKTGKDYVGIVISDTGSGFDSKVNYLKPGEGLHNIKERLELTYSECIFEVESYVGIGTTTTIIIPYGEEMRCLSM